MPTRATYPQGWKEFSRYVRNVVAGGRCQCTGECGLHRTTPGPRRCEELDGQPALWARGVVRLTVAHLNAAGGPCRCEPLCAIEAHVLALCQRCHNRYDVPRRRVNRSHTNARKRSGTLALFDVWKEDPQVSIKNITGAMPR